MRNLPSTAAMYLAYMDLCAKLSISPRKLVSAEEIEDEYIRLRDFFHETSHPVTNTTMTVADAEDQKGMW